MPANLCGKKSFGENIPLSFIVKPGRNTNSWRVVENSLNLNAAFNPSKSFEEQAMQKKNYLQK